REEAAQIARAPETQRAGIGGIDALVHYGGVRPIGGRVRRFGVGGEAAIGSSLDAAIGSSVGCSVDAAVSPAVGGTVRRGLAGAERGAYELVLVGNQAQDCLLRRADVV